MSHTSNRRRIWLSLAIGLPVSAVFGVLAFRNADLGDVADAIRDSRVGLLAAAIGLFAVMYLLQAVRWRFVAVATHIGTSTFVSMVVSAIAVNNVLPGRVGDLLRARWLGRVAHMPVGRALATVAFDRAGDVFALAILFAASVAQTDVPRWLRGVGFGAAAAVVLIASVVAISRAYANRHPRQRRDRGRVRGVVRDLIEGLAEPLGSRRVIVVLVFSLASWLAFACAALLVARSVGVKLSPTDAILVASVVNLGVAIPSSPGFVGTYQWLVVESVALVATVTREQALAVAILLHAAWYVPTTIVGGFLVVLRAARARSLRRAVAKEGPSQTSG